MSSNSLQKLIHIEKEIYYIQEDKLRLLIDRSDLFSNYEQDYCQHKSTPVFTIAGIWCAKQAFINATKLKLGFSDFKHLDLEIRHRASGQPMILLYNELASWFDDQNICVEVSIAHTKTLATAIALFWYH